MSGMVGSGALGQGMAPYNFYTDPNTWNFRQDLAWAEAQAMQRKDEEKWRIPDNLFGVSHA